MEWEFRRDLNIFRLKKLPTGLNFLNSTNCMITCSKMCLASFLSGANDLVTSSSSPASRMYSSTSDSVPKNEKLNGVENVKKDKQEK